MKTERKNGRNGKFVIVQIIKRIKYLLRPSVLQQALENGVMKMASDYELSY